MQAIILAAGRGYRLNQLTKNNTKCMIEINGVSLIERMLRQLVKFGVNDIIIVNDKGIDEILNRIMAVIK